MQRLRKLHRPQDDERGAVSVVVALLSVALIGFAAVSIDLAAVWADKQQLQTGADAAALAIAQDCADGACGSPSATAQSLAAANKNDGDVVGEVLSLGAAQVTVKTSTVREHWFAPVLGISSSPVNAVAGAAWGVPSGGTSILPLAIHQCEFEAQLQDQGGDLAALPSPVVSILGTKALKQSDLPADWPCAIPTSGNLMPGGFGWLDTDSSGSCATTSTIEDHVEGSDPGNSLPSGCPVSELVAMQNQTVLLPLFDNYGGEGNNAWYDITGYAAFTIKGYRFPSGGSWGVACPQSVNSCISGSFVEYVDISSAFEYSAGAPDCGAAAVRLTIPDIE